VPDILIRQANIPASTRVLPFSEGQSNWKFRRCPYQRGLYTIMVRSDGAAGALDHSVSIGTTEVVQRGQTSVGGADGVMPTPAGANATPAHQFYAEFNDEIVLELFETAAIATTDAMIWANVEPA
jgi:hypothetical protein